jgi:molybdopterin-binding protein
MAELYRIGDAASILGVRIETVRRWEREGKLKARRSSGGQRLIPASELARLLAEQRAPQERISSQSARNRFAGVVTAVKKEGLVATVEILAGPHRILALTTREAVEEMKLRAGMHAVAAVKATNVVVELPE